MKFNLDLNGVHDILVKYHENITILMIYDFVRIHWNISPYFCEISKYFVECHELNM